MKNAAMIRNALSLAFLALVPFAPAAVHADPQTGECDPDKSLMKACPPKSFRVVELPDSDATQELSTNAPFLLYAECLGGKGGLNCTGWPREQDGAGNLQYEWSFESAEAKLVFPRGGVSKRHVSCNAGERIVATLTVSNGSYRATSSQAYVCGTSI